MPSAPLFSIGDLVYLVSSAKIGFLESYSVTRIHNVSGSSWTYQINIRQRQPSEATIGDAVDSKYQRKLFFAESELTDFCTANQFRVTYLTRILAEAQALHDTRCSTGTG